jgi:hypothetical protein
MEVKMNLWIIGALIIGVLAIAGVFMMNTTTISADTTPKASSCGASYGNSCTAGSNCGLASCGAVNGGTCGCGKK